MIDGTPVKLGGTEYIVPPLNLKAVRLIQPLLPKLNSMNLQDPETIDAMVELVHVALKRNYPDLTKDAVEEIVDIGNLGPVVSAIMAVSGLVPKAVTGAPAGEAVTESPAPSVGMPSTQD